MEIHDLTDVQRAIALIGVLMRLDADEIYFASLQGIDKVQYV